jgi:polygalacturonase
MNKVVCLLLAGVFLLIPFLCPAMADTGAKTEYNIRDYGAVGDGKTLDSPAINKAIDACAASGGGTVYFPAGTYLSGSIHLKNNIHLFLDAGSVILGAPQAMKVYDQAEPFTGPAYQDGGHTFFHNSLIWGENLVDISITGPGMINGGGLISGDGHLDLLDGFAKPKAGAVPPTGDELRVGNKAISLKLCRNVLIRDVTIFHGGHFGILVTGCNRLTIDNVTIDTNRDGMDIDCCQNTAVSNCRINSPNDDGLCPKSTFALGRNVLTENLTISNCQVSGFAEGSLLDGTMKPSKSKTGRIKFGTEGTGGFRNCTITNCTFRDCRGLALEEVDGGIMQNIVISNLSMMGIANCPIYITTGSRNRGAAGTPPNPSVAQNILITNVVANVDDPQSGIQITGIPGQPIEGVRLDNIRIVFKGGGTKESADRIPKELGAGYPEPKNLGVMPAYGVFARHVKNLELANVNVSFETDDLRPAISCIDVDGLEIDHFKAALATGVLAAKFDSVKNLTVLNSPVIPAQGQ